jgi:hypothetical protein
MLLVGLLSCVALLPASADDCNPTSLTCTSFPGPVGIGTTQPTQTLEVFDGYLALTQPAGGADSAGFFIHQRKAPQGLGSWGIVTRSATGDLGFYNLTMQTDVLNLKRGGTANVNGRLGVGTLAAPQATLQLEALSGPLGILLNRAGAPFSIGLAAPGSAFYVNRGVTPGQSPDLSLAGGRVGIGTDPGAATLTVNGTIGIPGQALINAAGQWVGDPAGLKGPKGLIGDKGDTGPTGVTGAQGQQGVKGQTGPQGVTGPPGPTATTTARCNSNVSSSSATCESQALCPAGYTVMTGTRSGSVGACTVMGEQTDCSASGCDSNICQPVRYALCCVCRLLM